jgi:hypothetical protein
VYERLVVEMGVSGAEVLREALRSLDRARSGAPHARAQKPEEETAKAG